MCLVQPMRPGPIVRPDQPVRLDAHPRICRRARIQVARILVFHLSTPLRVLALALFLLASPSLGVMGLGTGLAAAADLASDLKGLASDDFTEIEAAIGRIAASGGPEAAAVLDAVAGRRAFADASTGRIYIRTASGYLDAATGKPAGSAPAAPEAVRVNNRIRRALDAASGLLALSAPLAADRQAAANSVFRSRDLRSLGALDQALQREQDANAKQALTEARAAILAFDIASPEVDRLAAIDTLRGRPDQETVSLLRSVPAGGSGAVTDRIGSTITAIESHLKLLSYAQNVWFGISLGSVLLLAAIGLAITFGVMGIINMAHGEMVMLGAYTVFVVQEYIFRPHFPAEFGWSLPVAIPLAFLVAAFAGVLIERGIIRFLYGRPLETLLATWGVSLILQQAIRTAFGANNREVGAPSYMSGSFDFFGLQITYGRLCIVGFALAVFFALLFVLRATSFGLKMRAVTQNRRMAAAMGIRTPRIDMFAFGLGSGIAGIAGVALSQIDNVSPQSWPELHRRQLHGRRLRRRGQSLGHACRRVDLGHRQQVSRALRRRGAR